MVAINQMLDQTDAFVREARVVVGESCDVMVERVQTCGGEDARLAHAAAEHLAPPARTGDQWCIAD